MLEDGSVYYLKDCKLEGGGTLILSVGETKDPPLRAKPRVKGEVIFPKEALRGFIEGLEAPVIHLAHIETKPSEKPLIDSSMLDHAPLTVVGGLLLFLLKKVAGLDRALKAGSCELRHQEAIIRIATLEGKVLRKQIVDGAKTAYGLKKKLSEDDLESGDSGSGRSEKNDV